MLSHSSGPALSCSLMQLRASATKVTAELGHDLCPSLTPSFVTDAVKHCPQQRKEETAVYFLTPFLLYAPLPERSTGAKPEKHLGNKPHMVNNAPLSLKTAILPLNDLSP